MKNLSVDLETFSSADLGKSGIYRYTEAPDFQILLFGYVVDDGEAIVIDMANGESIPEEITAAILDPEATKWAFNAQFERVCLSRHLGVRLSPQSWRCTMVWSAYMGLPLSLEGTGSVLGLENQKMKEGKELIRYFCIPCKPTKANGGRTRNLPSHSPEKWSLFKEYNKRDVEAEMGIKERLSRFPVPDVEWQNYILDQQINDRGIMLDMELVNQAIQCDEQFRSTHMERAKELTGLDNPNSAQQLKEWLNENGLEVKSLGKESVKELLEDADGEVKAALELRQELAKSSIKKYTAMENAVCADSRARGLIQFYGANRSGRFSGRLIQVQNLPQNHLPDLEHARTLIRNGNFEAVGMLYDSVPMVLSELIRTAFIPKPGHRFYVADFSAIEARVIAWLAGEKWRMDVFATHGKIYEASASAMFHVPIEQISKGSPLRQKGKIAELACIAEGSLVLTDKGLIPIENITGDHKLWDGYEWVSHEGVICHGEKEVISYGGLTATSDHYVWVEGRMFPIQFGIAASDNAHLLHTGTRMVGCKAEELAVHRSKARVYDIRNVGPRHRFTVSDVLVHNCGYGGSVGALKAMGALEMGLQESELEGLIKNWRSANPHIVSFWWDVDKAAIKAVKEHTSAATHGIRFTTQSGMLFITLPSGRNLCYVKPRIELNRFGSEAVTYEGIGEAKKWTRIESYGPKFVENIVQAVARDILTDAMRRLYAAGYHIVMHVHDEVVIEAPRSTSIEDICSIMGQTPGWAEGLLLRADGYVCDFYKKE